VRRFFTSSDPLFPRLSRLLWRKPTAELTPLWRADVTSVLSVEGNIHSSIAVFLIPKDGRTLFSISSQYFAFPSSRESLEPRPQYVFPRKDGTDAPIGRVPFANESLPPECPLVFAVPSLSKRDSFPRLLMTRTSVFSFHSRDASPFLPTCESLSPATLLPKCPPTSEEHCFVT